MAQGWNFGEVIMQTIEAAENRKHQMAIQERAQAFAAVESEKARVQESKEKGLDRDQQLRVLAKQFGYNKDLQELGNKAEMDRLQEHGRQTLKQIAASGKESRATLTLQQQPVSVEELEMEWRGTPLEGKFRSFANADGMVSHDDRATLLGLYMQGRALDLEDRKFNALMQDATRNYELARTAYEESRAPQEQPVPTRKNALGFFTEGYGKATAGALKHVFLGPAFASAFTDANEDIPAGMDEMVNAGSYADENEAAVRKALAANDAAYIRRHTMPDRIMDIHEQFKTTPVTEGTAAATELFAPIMQNWAQSRPNDPQLGAAAVGLDFGRGALLRFRLDQEAKMNNLMMNLQNRLDVANIRHQNQ